MFTKHEDLYDVTTLLSKKIHQKDILNNQLEIILNSQVELLDKISGKIPTKNEEKDLDDSIRLIEKLENEIMQVKEEIQKLDELTIKTHQKLTLEEEEKKLENDQLLIKLFQKIDLDEEFI